MIEFLIVPFIQMVTISLQENLKASLEKWVREFASMLPCKDNIIYWDKTLRISPAPSNIILKESTEQSVSSYVLFLSKIILSEL